MRRRACADRRAQIAPPAPHSPGVPRVQRLRKMRVADRAFIAKNPYSCQSQRPVRRKPVAAVHHQHFAIDKTARLRADEQRRLLNVSDSAETSQWNVFL